MKGSISTNNFPIIGLPRPSNGTQAVNRSHVDNSHLTPSGQQNNVFLYLMEDVKESSSEDNITVSGIVDFSQSPHQINKKAYEFTMNKVEGTIYRSTNWLLYISS